MKRAVGVGVPDQIEIAAVHDAIVSCNPLIPAKAGTQITGRGGRWVAFWTYIVASGRNGTIYAGHTDDLWRRAWEHREGVRPGFTRRHGCRTLVWFEAHETRDAAFRRERSIKEWRRSWKLMLIEDRNPTWRDLSDEIPV